MPNVLNAPRVYVLPGIHVNSREFPFARLIALGVKEIETRNKPTLHQYIGQRVGIIETGKGQARLIGYATISAVKVYDKYSDWSSDGCYHFCRGTSYEWKESTKVKYGYVMTYPELLPVPVLLPSESYTGDRTARDLNGYID